MKLEWTKLTADSVHILNVDDSGVGIAKVVEYQDSSFRGYFACWDTPWFKNLDEAKKATEFLVLDKCSALVESLVGGLKKSA